MRRREGVHVAVLVLGGVAGAAEGLNAVLIIAEVLRRHAENVLPHTFVVSSDVVVCERPPPASRRRMGPGQRGLDARARHVL